jgi:hypothetical protein
MPRVKATRRLPIGATGRERAPMSGGPGGADLRLSCQPSKAGGALVFPYAVENRGSAAVYVMHALPGSDPATGAARANDQAVVVILGAEGDAILGKFAAPLPTDRRIAVPVVPLARHLPAGGKLEARIEIPIPLAETSPYFPDLTLRQYEVVDIKGVVFTIGYWLEGADGLVAGPVDHAPDLSVVVTRDTWRSARRVSRRFPTTGLQIFRRTDAFPRVLPPN